MSRKGDFLLEVSGIPRRTHILLHPRTKPKHSTGCILLGPVFRSPDNAVYIKDDHSLRKMRTLFYGSDNPVSCPDLSISFQIVSNVGH